MKIYKQLRLTFLLGTIFSAAVSNCFAQENKGVFQAKEIGNSTLVKQSRLILDKDFENYELISLPFTDIRNIVKSSRGSSEFSISVGTKHQWHFEIFPSDNRGVNYKLMVATGGEIIEYPKSSNSTYKGLINGDSENFTRVFVNDNRFSAWINDGEESFYLEQINSYNKAAEQSDFVLYNIKDIKVDGALKCGLNDEDFAKHKASQVNLKVPAVEGSYPECIVLKSAVALDYAYVKWKNNDVTEAEAHLLEIFNLNSQIWEAVDIRYTLEETFVPASQNDDPFPVTNNNNTILNAFTKWVGENHWGTDYHINMILSAQDFGNLLGTAWISTLCTKRACAFNRKQNAPISMTHSFAHEWGHTWGCNHNGTKKVHVMPQGAGWTKLPVFTNQSQNTIIKTRGSVSCPVSCDVVGVEEEVKEVVFSLFPNPAKEGIQIEFPYDGKNEIVILDLSGKIIYQNKAVVGKTIRIDLNHLSNGMYFVKLKSNNYSFSDRIVLAK